MTGRLNVRLECGYSGDVDKGVLTICFHVFVFIRPAGVQALDDGIDP